MNKKLKLLLSGISISAIGFVASCGTTGKEGTQIATPTDKQLQSMGAWIPNISGAKENEAKLQAARDLLIKNTNVIANINKIFTDEAGFTTAIKKFIAQEVMSKLEDYQKAGLTDLDTKNMADLLTLIKTWTDDQTIDNSIFGMPADGGTAKFGMKSFGLKELKEQLDMKALELEVKALANLQEKWEESNFYKQINALVKKEDKDEDEKNHNPMLYWAIINKEATPDEVTAGGSGATVASVTKALLTTRTYKDFTKYPDQFNLMSTWGEGIGFLGLQTKESNQLTGTIFADLIKENPAITDFTAKAPWNTINEKDKLYVASLKSPIKIEELKDGDAWSMTGSDIGSITRVEIVKELLLLFVNGNNAGAWDTNFNANEAYNDFMDENINLTNYNHA